MERRWGGRAMSKSNFGLLSYQDLSQRLNVPVSTLYSWVHFKRIPFIRFSSRFVRFDPTEIDVWLRERRELSLGADTGSLQDI